MDQSEISELEDLWTDSRNIEPQHIWFRGSNTRTATESHRNLVITIDGVARYYDESHRLTLRHCPEPSKAIYDQKGAHIYAIDRGYTDWQPSESAPKSGGLFSSLSGIGRRHHKDATVQREIGTSDRGKRHTEVSDPSQHPLSSTRASDRVSGLAYKLGSESIAPEAGSAVVYEMPTGQEDPDAYAEEAIEQSRKLENRLAGKGRSTWSRFLSRRSRDG